MLKYRGIIISLLLVTIGLVYSIITIRPHIISIWNVEQEIKAKTLQYNDLEVQLQNLRNSEMEKKSTSNIAKNIYKPSIAGLDDESSFAPVFDDIIEMAKYNGIRVYSIEYIYNPPEDEFVKQAAAEYGVCQLKMQLISDYPDLESFLKEIFKYPYLINIEKIELTPYAKNKKILVINLQLKLYYKK